MAKSIAVISGKGGSGKTTLSLSMASLFSQCDLKVLLIDCDFATNGATYFYENKLDNKIICLSEVLNNEITEYNFIKVNENLSFMPSIKQIDGNNYSDSIRINLNTAKEKFKKFYQESSKNFDIILFDCQAGYTDLLKIILVYADINLAVMEADAISSAAMRSLYLKIAYLIKERKIYQVFNKITEEEYQIYSKISGGTVFTNIEAVIFDWGIRKAFAISQIPDMTNFSSKFGRQIFNIGSMLINFLFSDSKFQENLEFYKKTIETKLLHDKEKTLSLELADLKKKNKENKIRMLTRIYLILIPLMIIPVITSLYFLLDFKYEWSFILSICTSCVTSILVGFSIIDIARMKQVRSCDINEKQEEYNEIKKILLKNYYDLKKQDIATTDGIER